MTDSELTKEAREALAGLTKPQREFLGGDRGSFAPSCGRKASTWWRLYSALQRKGLIETDLGLRARVCLEIDRASPNEIACIRLLSTHDGSAIREYGERGRASLRTLRFRNLVMMTRLQLTPIGEAVARQIAEPETAS